MKLTNETMNLACGDSMLEGMPGGMMDRPVMSGGMLPDGLREGDAMLSMIQDAMAWMTQMTQSGMMDGGMMGGVIGPWMLLVPIVVLIGLGALAVWAIRKLTPASGAARSDRDPLEVARERYARGEIDREEFERLRADLRSP